MSDLEQNGFDSPSESRERQGGGRRFSRRSLACNGRPNSTTCPFFRDGECHISYLDVDTLRRYVTEEGKIRPRRQTRICASAQRRLARAIKRARHLALLPFTGGHVQEYG